MKKTIAAALALGALGVAAYFATYLAFDGRAFTVASDSMLPMLAKGATVWCLPAKPYVPRRGDLVIYTLPGREGSRLKMIVGLPGDRVAMRDGDLWLNGRAVDKKRLGDTPLQEPAGGTAKRFQEVLPGGATVTVLDTDPVGPGDTLREIVVPAGHVFVLGTNRDRSHDSRALSSHGPVPVANIRCRAATA